jgi:prepilin-type N-terminal cleavage/methylation domain-containing protein
VGSVRNRPGYTLLEILVATVIAVLLMSALYVAFDVTLSQADTGRGVVAEADFGRAVFNRMGLDLTLPVGPLPPKSGGGSFDDMDSTTTPSTGGTTSGTTTGTATGGTTSGGTTGGTGGTTSGTDTSGSTDSGSADAQSTNPASIPLQAGLIGTATQLTMFCSKVPTWLTDRSGVDTSDQQVVSDLRRITYYIHGSGKGLCRQEREWVTADGVQNSPDPDLSTQDADLIAPEVSAINIEYAAGGADVGWTGSWDGSQTSTDGTATTGPPRAIRVTLTLDLPDNNGKTVQKQIQQVFAVRAAVGLSLPPDPPATDPTMPSTGTGGM